MMIPGSFRILCRPIALAAAGLVMAALAPAHARAQASQPPAAPRLAVGAGGGVAQPLHADLDFVAGLWEVSVRGAPGRDFAVEAALGEWRREDRTEQAVTFPGIPRPDGRLTQESTRTGRSVEFSLLAVRRLGAVSVSAGGGVGALTLRREVLTSVTGCDASIAHLCGTSRTTTSSTTATILGLAGAEVAASDRLSFYGQFKFIGATRDFGSSEFRYSAGLRLAVWR